MLRILLVLLAHTVLAVLADRIDPVVARTDPVVAHTVPAADRIDPVAAVHTGRVAVRTDLAAVQVVDHTDSVQVDPGSSRTGFVQVDPVVDHTAIVHTDQVVAAAHTDQAVDQVGAVHLEPKRRIAIAVLEVVDHTDLRVVGRIVLAVGHTAKVVDHIAIAVVRTGTVGAVRRRAVDRSLHLEV